MPRAGHTGTEGAVASYDKGHGAMLLIVRGISKSMKVAATLLLAAALPGQTWIPQHSGTTASLRGVSAVNTMVVWASGSGGTYLRTTDGGATWHAATVPGAEGLDFRAVRAFDGQTAYLLSIGPGEESRIYKTADAGAHWRLLFTNPDPKGFYDALAFWDAEHGIVLGDPVDGHFTVLTTADGGEHWQPRQTPPAATQEGAFAASNSCLFPMGTAEAWFGTGGFGGARVFHSLDRGLTWSVAATPVRSDAATAGIFSLVFLTPRLGMAVGGDYTKPGETRGNVAVTGDGGRTWTEPRGHPAGFRSAVAVTDRAWISAGTSGSDLSLSRGAQWRPVRGAGWNAVSFVSIQAGWAVGAEGAIAKYDGWHGPQ